MAVSYRLGLDLGTNSIGWCALELDGQGEPVSVLDLGVRVMTPNDEAGRDPKSKVSLAAGRRDARSARKRRDRFIRRQKRLIHLLVQAGLMPADEVTRKQLELLDPYALRVRALDQALTPHELGRTLFHLNQRRGFKSNRVTDGDDKEKGATKQGIAALNQTIKQAGVRTLGEFLARRHAHNQNPASPGVLPVRFRPNREGNKVLYALYPTREMTAHEFEAIWAVQQPHHPAILTPELKQALIKVMLEQRPLKAPLVGNCSLRPNEPRAPKAMPIFQRFRMLMELANLEIEKDGKGQRKLTVAQRDALLLLLGSRASTVSFEAMHKALKLDPDERFNLERGGRKGLDPDLLSAKLKKAYGAGWDALSIERRTALVERLLGESDEGVLFDWLEQHFAKLDHETHEALANARLPQGYASFGVSVLTDLVAIMERDGIETHDPVTGELYAAPMTFDEAVKRLGQASGEDLHHSDRRPKGALLARLPYYGDLPALKGNVVQNQAPNVSKTSMEYRGRVPNPTVHIAMNQLRRVVNEVSALYGPPAEIVIELGRELKLNKEEKDKRTREMRENETENQRRRKTLRDFNQADTPGNMMLLRLYDELPADEKVCAYTGTQISQAMLFDGSIEVDHILPFSRTLDDGFGNKVLCTREANREKKNRTPWESFGKDPRHDYPLMIERVRRILPKKAWRFQPDAMERFERKGDFLARQLTDSQHMARLARRYLAHICADNKVWAVTGQLTSRLRGFWGLNSLLAGHNQPDGKDGKDGEARRGRVKNRDDHRHHAVDAFTIACTDRGILMRFAAASARAEEQFDPRLLLKGETPEPFPGYRDQLRDALDRVIISHRPDHAVNGQLHEETAFGLADDEIDGKSYNLVVRKPLVGLSEGEVERVRDRRLRDELLAVLAAAKQAGQKPEQALAAYGEVHGIRRVRILDMSDAVTIRHGAQNQHAKAYKTGSNYCIEIFETPDGKWHGEGVTLFAAMQQKRLGSVGQPVVKWPSAHPDAKLMMRLRKGDTIALDEDGGGTGYYIVRKLDPNNRRVAVVRHSKAGKIEGGDYLQLAYSRLKQRHCTLVHVDPAGRVFPIAPPKPD